MRVHDIASWIVGAATCVVLLLAFILLLQKSVELKKGSVSSIRYISITSTATTADNLVHQKNAYIFRRHCATGSA